MSAPHTLVRASRLDALALAGADGRGWYRAQRALLRAWSDAHGVDYGRVCSVVALTSPRTTVAGNGRLAAAYLSGVPAGALAAVPATRVALARWEATGEWSPRAPKVAAFARALEGDDSAMVLDVHMAHAVGVPQSSLVGAAYARAAAHVSRGAHRLGWTPVEYQAAVWTAVRRAAGRTRSQTYVILPPLSGGREGRVTWDQT